MRKSKIAVLALAMVCLNSIAMADSMSNTPAGAPAMDCSNMGMDMQQFAAQLSPANKKVFCGQFTDTQRASAMQMASQKDSSGSLMTADQAVQKAASSTSGAPNQRTPTGCPVK